MGNLHLKFYSCLRLRFLDVETNPGPRRPVLASCRLLCSNVRGLSGILSDLAVASSQYDILLCTLSVPKPDCDMYPIWPMLYDPISPQTRLIGWQSQSPGLALPIFFNNNNNSKIPLWYRMGCNVIANHIILERILNVSLLLCPIVLWNDKYNFINEQI